MEVKLTSQQFTEIQLSVKDAFNEEDFIEVKKKLSYLEGYLKGIESINESKKEK